MPQSQSSSAIVLRTRPYGDIDVIATFLTRDFGKLTGIAKGAKHSRRRFANCLEPFARVRVIFRSKAGATLAFLERCELVRSGYGMAHPSRFAYGSYLLELVDLLTHEGDPIVDVFDLFEAGLAHVEEGPATSGLLRGFEMHLLHVLGYSPVLQRCPACGSAFGATDHVLFDALQGQVFCEKCAAPTAQTQRFRADTVAELARLQTISLAESRSTRLAAATAGEAAQLVGHLLAPHLPRPLRSLELIAALGR